ncbi:transglycosylase SLT domain-containing protein [Roseovarius sp. 2305UL8-3]|uniref:transglycosylase SLT domain-containing protein n=1 Tax=Roseovarius conchicola TaxID=3121636 RepID=UPI0035293E11
MILRLLFVLLLSVTAACSTSEAPAPAADVPLYPNETPEIRALVNQYADFYEVPRPLVHKVIQRESDYRPRARNGPYYGMMQILPATARGMGFRGSPNDLLDAETNLTWAVKYLKGAWMVSGGDLDAAVMWYARGYYYEAKRQCLLVETGLNDRETNRACG